MWRPGYHGFEPSLSLAKKSNLKIEINQCNIRSYFFGAWIWATFKKTIEFKKENNCIQEGKQLR